MKKIIKIEKNRFYIGKEKFSIKDSSLDEMFLSKKYNNGESELVLRYISEDGHDYIGTSCLMWGEEKNPNLKKNLEKTLGEKKVCVLWWAKGKGGKQQYLTSQIHLVFPSDLYKISMDSDTF